MSLEEFNVQAPYSGIVTVIVICFIAFGAILVALGVFNKVRYFGYSLLNSKYTCVIGGTVLILTALGLSFVYYAPSTITVGNGYINVQFAAFSTIPPIGAKNITSSQISSAFVSQIGSGVFDLNKQNGINNGDTNVGVFTLGNGATAYVASTNSTDLIIELKNGQYVILGTSNTEGLAASFAQHVFALK